MEIQAVIVTGGLATRLRPVSDGVPKALVEVRGRPFLEHQLEVLSGQGIRDVVLCIGHLGGRIRDRFGDGERLGMRLRYSEDGPTLLGTGGALKRAGPALAERFFVLDGDTYLPLDHGEVVRRFEAAGAPALMVVYRNEDRYDSSNAVVDGTRVKVYDRSRKHPGMTHIHAGLSLLRKPVLDLLPDGRPCSQEDLWRLLAERGELAAFETSQRFYEVGSPGGLSEFRDLVGRAGGAP